MQSTNSEYGLPYLATLHFTSLIIIIPLKTEASASAAAG